MSEGKTVRVTRRRRSSPSQSGGRERAATPRRGQREESARPNRPSGTVTSGTGAPGYGTTPSNEPGLRSGLQPDGREPSCARGLLNLWRAQASTFDLGLIAAVLCVCVMPAVGRGAWEPVDEFTTVRPSKSLSTLNHGCARGHADPAAVPPVSCRVVLKTLVMLIGCRRQDPGAGHLPGSERGRAVGWGIRSYRQPGDRYAGGYR